MPNLDMEEKSFGRGNDYVSAMTDIDRSPVLEVDPGRVLVKRNYFDH